MSNIDLRTHTEGTGSTLLHKDVAGEITAGYSLSPEEMVTYGLAFPFETGDAVTQYLAGLPTDAWDVARVSRIPGTTRYLVKYSNIY